MSVQVKRRRDTAANLASYVGAQAELLVDTTNNRVQVHDGVTAGGWPAAKLSEVVTNGRTAVSDAAYTASASDRSIAFAALTAARVVTMPAASAYPTGTRLIVFDEFGILLGCSHDHAECGGKRHDRRRIERGDLQRIRLPRVAEQRRGQMDDRRSGGQQYRTGRHRNRGRSEQSAFGLRPERAFQRREFQRHRQQGGGRRHRVLHFRGRLFRTGADRPLRRRQSPLQGVHRRLVVDNGNRDRRGDRRAELRQSAHCDFGRRVFGAPDRSPPRLHRAYGGARRFIAQRRFLPGGRATHGRRRNPVRARRRIRSRSLAPAATRSTAGRARPSRPLMVMSRSKATARTGGRSSTRPAAAAALAA